MKRLSSITTIFSKKLPGLRYFGQGVLASFLAFGAYKVGVPVWKEFQTSFAYREFKQYGVVGTYQRRFFGSFSKFSELEKLDRENRELHTRLALLERDFELERARNASQEMKAITDELAERIKEQGGSDLARVISSISYQVPSHLLPHQLYALALGYFRKQEYEQAAAIFHHLLNLQDDTSYQRGEVQLLSAISWYHLKNYKMAKHFLRTVTKGANPQTGLYRTAILWNAILAQAEGKKSESQRMLTAAVAQFPHSQEAQWINGKWMNRKDAMSLRARQPASRQEREPNQSLSAAKEPQEASQSIVKPNADESVHPSPKGGSHESDHEEQH